MTVTDLERLLDQLPLWRAINAFPKRIAELERRVDELESRVNVSRMASPIPDGKECPLCNGLMKVTRERPHDEFGFSGRKTHSMECTECGNKAERDFEPGKGYK